MFLPKLFTIAWLFHEHACVYHGCEAQVGIVTTCEETVWQVRCIYHGCHDEGCGVKVRWHCGVVVCMFLEEVAEPISISAGGSIAIATDFIRL